MSRKGFPESYDVRGLMNFLVELKAGAPTVRAPCYSHITYDVVADDEIVLASPDIVILEGVNVLQTPSRRGRVEASVVVSDFFDFSIYVDAPEEDLERWYVDRLLLLRETSLHDPRSYFNFLTQSTEEATREFAHSVWNQVNLVNLRENIAPTRGRAHLVLEKDSDHAIGARTAAQAVVSRPRSRPARPADRTTRARRSTPRAGRRRPRRRGRGAP